MTTVPPEAATAYVISAVLCGISGMLLANLNAFASPSLMSWLISSELIVMVVLGGLGSILGPIAGAVVFLGLEEGLKQLTTHWMAVFGIVITIAGVSSAKGLSGWWAGRRRTAGVAELRQHAEVQLKAAQS